MNVRRFVPALVLAGMILTGQAASGPASLRTTPPAGIRIAAADRAVLERGTAELAGEIETLRSRAKSEERVRALLPDVEIFHKAVDWALRYDEFFRTNEVALARMLLEHGRKRAQRLAQGDPFWLNSTGLVVRGFRSKIDDSVQPYGLVVPASFAQSTNRPRRLDVWLHGRDDRLTELKFLGDRLRSYGEFTPPDTFVLHPYGRFCNAFKFAGETDVFEALEHAKKSYPIDELRIGLRGFSMGGAGVWHLAAHHPSVWTAAAPGAGFAETAEYTGALRKEPRPTWWEQKLWNLYDATAYAANFHNLPVIAYSGELDKQKQAADMMARAMKAEGLELDHLIGPGVAHKYEPGAKKELARRFDELMAKGRNLPWKGFEFTTFSLRYGDFGWGRILQMENHWQPARVHAQFSENDTLVIRTTNVAQLELDALPLPLESSKPAHIQIDGRNLHIPPSKPNGPAFGAFATLSDRVITKDFAATAGDLYPGIKRPALQGPIDDAFMERFVVVRSANQGSDTKLGLWLDTELARFTNEWRAQFRGDTRIMDATEDVIRIDDAVKLAAIEGSHLILWGDPASNPVIAKLLPQLPLRWDAKELRLGTNRFDATTHVPILIYPNPLNPARYVVLNSGPTFLDFGAGSNAQQTPKLPDFAVIDITVPRAERLTKGVVLAGFFDEQWLLPQGPQP